jgi:hypothetical protein
MLDSVSAAATCSPRPCAIQTKATWNTGAALRLLAAPLSVSPPRRSLFWPHHRACSAIPLILRAMFPSSVPRFVCTGVYYAFQKSSVSAPAVAATSIERDQNFIPALAFALVSVLAALAWFGLVKYDAIRAKVFELCNWVDESAESRVRPRPLFYPQPHFVYSTLMRRLTLMCASV